MKEFEGKELRLRADMEVALERSCALVKRTDHEARKFMAQKIIDAANEGRTTLGELTEAGRQAAGLLGAIKSPGQGGGTLA